MFEHGFFDGVEAGEEDFGRGGEVEPHALRVTEVRTVVEVYACMLSEESVGIFHSEGSAINPCEVGGLLVAGAEHGQFPSDEVGDGLSIGAQGLQELFVPLPTVGVGCERGGVGENIESGQAVALCFADGGTQFGVGYCHVGEADAGDVESLAGGAEHDGALLYALRQGEGADVLLVFIEHEVTMNFV